MKVITEAIIRAELKATEPEVYFIPEGKILSPAAREYLNQMQVEIDFEKNRAKREEKIKAKGCHIRNSQNEAIKDVKEGKARYEDYETGASYWEKPEHMTQLKDNLLVDKNHPRIKLRGKMDRLQAEVVHAQAFMKSLGESSTLIEELDDILRVLREIMRCDVLDEEYISGTIIGLNHAELRERSHNPMKFYKIKQMLLPEYSMGVAYSFLNMLRTSIRETEVIAVDTFKTNRKVEKAEIIEEFNRLSSALHIMMCRYLAGDYKDK